MSSSNALTPVSRGNRRVRNLEGKEVGGLWGLHVSWQAPPVQAGQEILKLEGCTAGQLCVGNNSARQMKRGSLLWSQMGQPGSGSLADVKVTAGQVHFRDLVKSK